MEADPHSSSAIHTHGDQDTIVYSLQGTGEVVFDYGKQRQHLKPGEYVLPSEHGPAWPSMAIYTDHIPAGCLSLRTASIKKSTTATKRFVLTVPTSGKES